MVPTERGEIVQTKPVPKSFSDKLSKWTNDMFKREQTSTTSMRRNYHRDRRERGFRHSDRHRDPHHHRENRRPLTWSRKQK